MMARVISLAGAALPDLLVPAAADNPRGFWEPAEMVALDDELLAHCGSAWDDILCLRVGDRAIDAPVELKERVAAFLDKVQGEPAVLKDPRASLMMGFWARSCGQVGIQPLHVIMVRHPMDVASSLAARNQFPVEKSLLLWSAYMLAIERDTRSVPRVFASYESVLSDPIGSILAIGETLGLKWPRPVADFEAQINEFLTEDLRHFTSRGSVREAVPLAWSGVDDLYDWLAQAASGEVPSPEIMETLRSEFERFIGSFAPVFDDISARAQQGLEQSQELQVLSRLLQDHKDEIEVSRIRMAELHAQADGASQMAAAKEIELGHVREALAAEAAARAAEVAALQDSSGAAIAAAQAQFEHAAEVAAAKEAELIQAREALAAEAASRALELANLEGRSEAAIASLRADSERAAQAAAAKEAELTQARERLSMEAAQLARELAMLEGHSQATIATLRAECERAAQMLASRDAELAEARKALTVETAGHAREAAERSRDVAVLEERLKGAVAKLEEDAKRAAANMAAKETELAQVRKSLAAEIAERAREIALIEGRSKASLEALQAEATRAALASEAKDAELAKLRDALAIEVAERSRTIAALQDHLSAKVAELEQEAMREAAAAAAKEIELAEVRRTWLADAAVHEQQIALIEARSNAALEALRAEADSAANAAAAAQAELAIVSEKLATEAAERARETLILDERANQARAAREAELSQAMQAAAAKEAELALVRTHFESAIAAKLIEIQGLEARFVSDLAALRAQVDRAAIEANDLRLAVDSEAARRELADSQRLILESELSSLRHTASLTARRAEEAEAQAKTLEGKLWTEQSRATELAFSLEAAQVALAGEAAKSELFVERLAEATDFGHAARRELVELGARADQAVSHAQALERAGLAEAARRSHLEARVAELLAQLSEFDSIKAENAAIRDSTSWRMTGPIRRLLGSWRRGS